MDFTNKTFLQLDHEIACSKVNINNYDKKIKRSCFLSKLKKNELLQKILQEETKIKNIQNYLDNNNEYYKYKNEDETYGNCIIEDLKNNRVTLFHRSYYYLKFLMDNYNNYHESFYSKFKDEIAMPRIDENENEIKVIFIISDEAPLMRNRSKSIQPNIITNVFNGRIKNNSSFLDIKNIISKRFGIKESRIVYSTPEYIKSGNKKGGWYFDYNTITLRPYPANDETKFVLQENGNINIPVIIGITLTHSNIVPDFNDIKFLHNKIKELEIKIEELSNNKI